MNRRKFLRRLGIVSAATVAAPMIVRELLSDVHPKDLTKGSYLGMSDTPTDCNSPVILKDTYEITGSDRQDVSWVEDGKGNCYWYMQSEVETRRKFEDKMEAMHLHEFLKTVTSK